MCRKNITETEKHIFLECSTIQQAKQTLGTILKTKQTDALNKTITLNHITKSKNRTDDDNKLTATAIFRQTIWTTRNNSRFRFKHYRQNDVNSIFKAIMRQRLGIDFIN